MKTSKQASRIIAELCRLSRNGWANATPDQYEPLETALRKLVNTKRKP